MIYLLSQMLLIVVAAVIFGLAVGWLVHRSTHASKVHKLQQSLRRQRSQVAQAQSEVKMLKDDYDELQRSTQDRISELSIDNEQIPALQDNLEKSQLLVQQNMKRHESRIRNLTAENEKLQDKLALAGTSDNKVASASGSAESVSRFSKNFSGVPVSDNTFIAPRNEHTVTEEVAEDAVEEPNADTTQTPQFVAAESEHDPFDQVIEVDDNFQLEFDQTHDTVSDPISKDDVDLNEETLTTAATTVLDIDAVLDEDSEQIDLGTDLSTNLSTDMSDNSDSDYRSQPRFTPSTTQDDLQQIFGIGPLTEKALNELGITSYSQLAQLEQHDIQHIADALDIGAGRIERDNWVGNARRQLEEVLEEL